MAVEIAVLLLYEVWRCGLAHQQADGRKMHGGRESRLAEHTRGRACDRMDGRADGPVHSRPRKATRLSTAVFARRGGSARHTFFQRACRAHGTRDAPRVV